MPVDFTREDIREGLKQVYDPEIGINIVDLGLVYDADIADNGENDYMKRSGKDQEPGYVVNGEAIQRSRLRVDARKWLLSKLAPKKYGDKIETTLQGPDGGAIQVVGRIERAIIKPSENTKA